MIKSITVTNYLGESIKMELGFPERSGFLIHNIEGLGPSKASINSTELATTDGSLFNSSRVNSRNIVLTLKLLANPTVEASRQKTYKYFPTKKLVKLEFETDNRNCQIYGYVESNEPVIFSEKETTQISIMCLDPYFYSKAIHNTVFAFIEPMFEFPFSNESLTQNLLEMGEKVFNQEKTIKYDGDAEVGVVIYIHTLGNVENITIGNSRTHEIMKINTDRLLESTGLGFIYGDDIIISTVKGQKYIHLIRGGKTTNILNCLDKNNDWFQIAKGDNTFNFIADKGSQNLQFRIENRIVYEGI